MTLAQQDANPMLESLVSDVIAGRKTISSIAERIGPDWAASVKQVCANRGHIKNGNQTAQHFFAKQAAERRKFFRARTIEGNKTHRASQQDHDYIVKIILDNVDAGIRPDVRFELESYGRLQQRAPEWANSVVARKQTRKMGKTLAAYKDHAVLRDLKAARMLSQTHKSALQGSTYSGFAELLFSALQAVRIQRAMEVRIALLEAELLAAKTENVRVTSRLDLKERGMDWKEAARAILSMEPDISNRKLACRVGVSEGAIRKYLTERSSNRGMVLA